MEQREALITGAVLAVACALISMLVLVGRGPGDEVTLVDQPRVSEREPETTDPETTDPDSSDPEATDPDDSDLSSADELDAFVDEAIEFIETTRGREFLDDPVVLALDDDDFVARLDSDLAEQFAEQADEIEMYNHFYRSLAMIGPGESIDEVYREFGAAGVLGFYDPTTDELVVRQVGDLSLATKSTIVHELTHAFDDQHLDLDRPEYDDREDEIPWTFSAAVEGSASWLESQWRSQLTGQEQAALLAEELSFGGASDFDAFEISFLLYELSVYTYGEPFIEGVVRRDGVDAIDAVIAEPPATSEQVIDPPAFFSDEGALAIDAPPADGEVEVSEVGGAALIDALFQGNLIRQTVAWGGDQLVIWADGDSSCVRWDIRADDELGAAGLQSGFERWIDIVGNGTVTVVDATTIRVDRCS